VEERLGIASRCLVTIIIFALLGFVCIGYATNTTRVHIDPPSARALFKTAAIIPAQ
jgi:hypothetical protein